MTFFLLAPSFSLLSFAQGGGCKQLKEGKEEMSRHLSVLKREIRTPVKEQAKTSLYK
jgi:hypothetical protein